MKRTRIERIPYALPDEILSFTRGAQILDSSSSPDARVYFIDKGCGYYLKVAPRGALGREAELTSYFHSLGMGAEVLHYHSDENDMLVTARVAGEDCTHGVYLSEPIRLCDRLGEELRRLHETAPCGCPQMNRTEEYIRGATENYRTGNFDSSHFPDSFGYRSADEAYAVLLEGKGALCADTLIHGDYCLPNIMLDDWRLSGFIDVGHGGISDRHIDLFWGAWSLAFNLGTDRYRDRFFDAYGRDKIDNDILRVVAAAEVFG